MCIIQYNITMTETVRIVVEITERERREYQSILAARGITMSDDLRGRIRSVIQNNVIQVRYDEYEY